MAKTTPKLSNYWLQKQYNDCVTAVDRARIQQRLTARMTRRAQVLLDESEPLAALALMANAISVYPCACERPVQPRLERVRITLSLPVPTDREDHERYTNLALELSAGAPWSKSWRVYSDLSEDWEVTINLTGLLRYSWDETELHGDVIVLHFRHDKELYDGMRLPTGCTVSQEYRTTHSFSTVCATP